MALSKKALLAAIEKARKQALSECKEYHLPLLKSEGEYTGKTANDLLYYLYDIPLEGWEDVGFFVGLLRGLDRAESIISESK